MKSTTYSDGGIMEKARVEGLTAGHEPSGDPTRGSTGSVSSGGPCISETESSGEFENSLEKMGCPQYENTKPCEVCGVTMRPRWQDSPVAQKRARARHAFRSVRTCSPRCQGLLQRSDPNRRAKTRSGASNTAKRLKPRGPCERCGEVRQSHVHHKNRDQFDNRLENLERLCVWCHAKEHAAEAKARAPQAWATRRQRSAAA